MEKESNRLRFVWNEPGDEDRGYYWLQAFRGATRVGYAEAYEKDAALFIKYMEVHPRFRRHGYGREIALEILRYSRQKGLSGISGKPRDLRAAIFWEVVLVSLGRLGDMLPGPPGEAQPLPRVIASRLERR